MSETEPTPQALVEDLVTLLTVERLGADHFQAPPKKDGVGRVFGGQVIAQALQAAQATIEDDKVAHSLHAYFLRGGTEGVPIDLATDRQFEGRSFANRRVVASQDGSPILNLAASFQRPEQGLEHQDPAMPDVPPPEDLPTGQEAREKVVEHYRDRLKPAQVTFFLRPRPVELRPVGSMHWTSSEPQPPRTQVWFRAVAPLPDDPALHRAVIAYASDFNLLGTAVMPHGVSWMRGELISASLDHALWFHRPARADEWLLYSTDSPWSGNGRGFNRGQIFDRNGTLVASVAQEGMIRRAREKR
ncbi:acyl-CoA thioesterase II [Erythrobacter sp. LQ02-29]|uniref:acyl-CoA thioesterase n=1 Tax=Erythrobacter sp. LQ02-29 TaxID=2920384 RepID=UPI001F4ED7EB|nr:acyl-CoA thioesterase II [Erythrobacter sp. LQ02-29]MCP9223800.1 acyl-CoA thioesterase II [Erythrobacter sp. LQ02-29]